MPLEFGGATNPAMWSTPPWWQQRKRGPKSDLPFPGLPSLTGLPNVSPQLPKTAMPSVQNPGSYAAGAFGNAFAQVGSQAAQQQRQASPQALQQQQQAGAQARGTTPPAFQQTATAEPAKQGTQTQDMYSQFLAALGVNNTAKLPVAQRPPAPGTATVEKPLVPTVPITTQTGTGENVPPGKPSDRPFPTGDRNSAVQWWNSIRNWINSNKDLYGDMIGQTNLPDLGAGWQPGATTTGFAFQIDDLIDAAMAGDAARVQEYLRSLNSFAASGTNTTTPTTPGGEWGNLNPADFGDSDYPETYTGPGGNTWDELRQFIGWTNTAGGGAWGFLTTLTADEQKRVLQIIGRTNLPSVTDLKMAGEDFIMAWAQRLAQAWAYVRGLGDWREPATGDNGAAAAAAAAQEAAKQQQDLVDQFKRYIGQQQAVPAGSIRGGYSQSPTTWYY